MEENILKEETLKKILHSHFKEEKTKLTPEALKLFAKFSELFVAEIIDRSLIQANNEDVLKVEIEHLEKILPQLMLDF